MENDQGKKSVSRRKFVATLGATGLGAVLAAGLGSGGTAYASVTDTVTSYDTMAQLQAATDLRTGTIVYTKGFYAAGDGGGAYWNVLGTGTADQLFIYACDNGKFVSLVHDGTINIKQVGVRADGVQVANTYPTGLSGFPASLAGTTRDFWVSNSGSETSNFDKLKAIVSARYNVYVPKGIYVFAGKSTIHVRNGLCFIGESMGESNLIGLGFSNYGVLEECNDILFENFTMDNYASILPPGNRKLRYLAEGFDTAQHWDLNDYKSFSYRDGDYRSAIANAMQFVNGSEENKNITVRRVKVKNYWCGFGFGTKTPTGPMALSRDILVEECVFEDIMYQPLGTNNVQNIRFLRNSFDNIGLQACDFSRGSIGCEFTGNYVTRASSMVKVEGSINNDFTRVLSDQFIIRDNIYKQPPGLTDWQFESKFVIDNLTGDGLVSGNFLEMGYVHNFGILTAIRRETLGDTVRITDNHFVTPTTSKYEWACMFSVQRVKINGSTDYPSAGKNIIFDNNHVTMRMSTVGCYMPTVTTATQIVLRNNLFVSDGAGYVSSFVLGCSNQMEITGNSLDRVRVVLETEISGVLRELDIKTILVTDNRLFSDYTNDFSVLGQPLIHVAGNVNNKTESIVIRGNYTNRSSLLKVEKMKFIRIDMTDNVMQENVGNSAQFGCQPLAVGAVVDDLNFEGNMIWFPNATYSGILAFTATNTRNVKRLVMENNTMSLSGQLATGAPSSGLKPDVFLFRNNKVYKFQTNSSIAVNAVKGSVSLNVFDSTDVAINAFNVLFTQHNENTGGTITVTNPRP
jgi:hypothetical protein